MPCKDWDNCLALTNLIINYILKNSIFNPNIRDSKVFLKEYTKLNDKKSDKGNVTVIRDGDDYRQTLPLLQDTTTYK